MDTRPVSTALSICVNCVKGISHRGTERQRKERKEKEYLGKKAAQEEIDQTCGVENLKKTEYSVS